MVTSSGKFLITGGINIHVDDTSDATSALKFLDLLDSFNLIPHISTPTHKIVHFGSNYHQIR